MLRIMQPAAFSGRYETSVKLADNLGTHYRGTSLLVEWTCMESDQPGNVATRCGVHVQHLARRKCKNASA
jgi:hypothetical protein